MKTLILSVRNTFYDELVLEVTMPVERRKAIIGEYSGLWKDMRLAFASQQKVSKESMKASLKFTPEETQNITVKTRKGLKLVFPADYTRIDLQIIQKHLDALILAYQ